MITEREMWNLCSTGWPSNDVYVLCDISILNQNLSTIVLHNNITFHRQDWNIKNDNENSPISSLKGTEGDTTLVGCQIEKSHPMHDTRFTHHHTLCWERTTYTHLSFQT